MKKKYAVSAISILSIAVVILGVFAGVNYEKAKRYELYAANNCRHAFDELVTAMSEMDSALQKSLYASSPAMVSAVCTDIFGKAMTAQMSLGVLPFSAQELERTSGFISRVGDYAYSLSRSAGSSQTYSQEELENLHSLADTAQVLAQNLKGLQADMDDGTLTMDELYAAERKLEKYENANLPATLGDGMRLIEQEFPEVPALIYDGPFSEHISQSSPKMLEGRSQVDRDTARDIASRFTGIARSRVYPAGECAGDIPCWYFAADAEDNTTSIAVSKQGGRVMSMLCSRQVGISRLDAETAVKKAEEFLLNHGYSGMRETYHMAEDNILTVNFAWEQDGVICYSDLIKVSVALDDGRICGFEAQGYLSSHGTRDLPEVKISPEEAAAAVSPELEVLEVRRALIPSAGRYEKLCHEFVCSNSDEQKYIIYVNAESGEQEKILILLENESGTLTL